MSRLLLVVTLAVGFAACDSGTGSDRSGSDGSGSAGSGAASTSSIEASGGTEPSASSTVVSPPAPAAAPVSDLLRHISVPTDPVTAHVRNLRSSAAAVGVPLPAADGSTAEWGAWAQAARCCSALEPLLPDTIRDDEFADLAGWWVADVETVATASVGGEPAPVVARGAFRTERIEAAIGGAPGELVTLGTPGEFDLEASSAIRPLGRSVSFVYDEAMLIAGYDPAAVDAAAAGPPPCRTVATWSTRSIWTPSTSW